MSTVTLHLGDCLEYMRTMPAQSVDAVVTDPPYGIAHSSNYGATWENTMIANDFNTDARDTIIEWANNRLLSWLSFGSWKVEPPQKTKGVLIWDKGPNSGMGDLSFPFKMSYEEVYIGGPGWNGTRDEGVIRGHSVITWESKGRTHPHEKPVSLMAYLLSKLPKGATVFDPFMGSGTTGVACVRTGRNFIGCEIDPTYYAIAQRRIAEAQLQPPLFPHEATVQPEQLPLDSREFSCYAESVNRVLPEL